MEEGWRLTSVGLLRPDRCTRTFQQHRNYIHRQRSNSPWGHPGLPAGTRNQKPPRRSDRTGALGSWSPTRRYGWGRHSPHEPRRGYRSVGSSGLRFRRARVATTKDRDRLSP